MKQRLDTYLVEHDHTDSREKAKAMIIAGQVLVDNRPAKPSQMVDEANEVTVKPVKQFVSRGGLKLEKALEVFDVSVDGKVAVDVGASTGGFTDCLLRHGVRRVFAVDVGYGQLDYMLRVNPRVTVMERVNARALTPDMFDERLNFACMDVSFISIKLILPALTACLTPGSDIVTLIKPQFEAGRDKVGKNGIVRDKRTHVELLDEFIAYFKSVNFNMLGLNFSPIAGQQGNIEFLCHLRCEEYADNGIDIVDVVERAHIQVRGSR